MSTVYNEDVLEWLESKKSIMVAGIQEVRRLQAQGSLYTTANKTTLLNSIKAKCAAITALDVTEYAGADEAT
jgi:hypothetical protein|tara:strand:+ start:966 stop:1181 length:216 start_codon:yes stop_codon:yes gene_type:complete